ncbi:hypothetical protein B0I35DRAFT_476660 [Stachybotrys elegans]|uniref:Myb-like domain-containing protein n=1 Tax=Stachybotrys elegans TaxID=80388 RepID=A0A8K0WSU3_9HYPO|nr:hypothetical protein B0I35DRAFT_476660 [Stachybotrys elegans]
MMEAEPREAPLADMDTLEPFDHASDGGGVDDDDFGPLEMFDSNALQSTYSSQLDSGPGPAPEAVMSEEPPSSVSTKKSKRKKDKKKKDRHARSSSGAAEAKSKKHSNSSQANEPEPIDGIYPSFPENDENTPMISASPGDQTVESASRSKKKRKLSDTAESKRRKKRRSEDDTQAQAEETTNGDAEPPTFLHKGQLQPDFDESMAPEDEQAALDRQLSPSAGRSRRNRKSRSAQPEGAVDEMEVDPAPAAEPVQQLAEQGQTADDRDMEDLAREAWNEHVGARNEEPAEPALQEAVDETMAEQSQYPEPEVPDESQDMLKNEPAATPAKRSTRKKAKPTYYEQSPQQDEDDDAVNQELPSPSAMEAQPKKRRKPAARKQKAPKLSQSMQGGSDNEAAENDNGRPGRRNRMAGYTQGRFTDEELARIASAIEGFRSENDLTQYQVNDMIQAPGGTTAGDAHAQLWVRVFAECPDRHRQKVINVCRKRFHNFVARGTWTPEQDAELSELTRIHGTKWSYIAGIINRHPEDVRDRYRNYIVCGDNQRKDAWDEEEESRLTKLVIEAMSYLEEIRQSEPNNPNLQRADEELIDWQHISGKMDRTRSRLQCITKWKALQFKTHGKDKLESQKPNSKVSFRLEKARRHLKEMEEADRFRLVLAVHSTVNEAENKIPWAKLVDKAFRTKWHRSTQMLLWKRLRETVQGWETKPIKETAQLLIEYYNQNGSLPEVDGDNYDDDSERKHLQAGVVGGDITASQMAPTQTGLSAEYVLQSDLDEEAAEAAEAAATGHNGNGEAGVVGVADMGEANGPVEDELKIDPALSAALAQTTPPPALQSPSRALASFKRQGKRDAGLLDDPIEDDEGRDGMDDASQPQEEEEQAPWGQTAAHAQRMADDAASDSVMDDMEDLPARVMA